jgi:N-acetylmuramoyl-L-alanine amidase
MSKALEYSIIHCSDTANHKQFTAEDIKSWHTDPKPLGNGWNKPGYNEVIERDGKVVTLVPYDDNEWVEPWEMANGVRGYNPRARHRVLIGKDKFTEAQYAALRNRLIEDVMHHPDIKIGGHGQLDEEKFFCPGFDTIAKLEEWEFPEKNILRV